MSPQKQAIQGDLVIDGQSLQRNALVRRGALHDTYGGNPRGGIATLGLFRAVLVFSGSEGETYGYHDEWLPNGTFRYYGEGQLGDMQLDKGNGAIDRHSATGDRLFLFDTNSGRENYVIYRGEFKLARRGED